MTQKNFNHFSQILPLFPYFIHPTNQIFCLWIIPDFSGVGKRPLSLSYESSRMFLMQGMPRSPCHASLATLVHISCVVPCRPGSHHTRDMSRLRRSAQQAQQRFYKQSQNSGWLISPWCVVPCRPATRAGKAPHTRRRASTAREASSQVRQKTRSFLHQKNQG